METKSLRSRDSSELRRSFDTLSAKENCGEKCGCAQEAAAEEDTEFCSEVCSVLPAPLWEQAKAHISTSEVLKSLKASKPQEVHLSLHFFPRPFFWHAQEAAADEDTDFCSDVCSVLLAAISERAKAHAPAEAAAAALPQSAARSHRLQYAAQVRQKAAEPLVCDSFSSALPPPTAVRRPGAAARHSKPAAPCRITRHLSWRQMTARNRAWWTRCWPPKNLVEKLLVNTRPRSRFAVAALYKLHSASISCTSNTNIEVRFLLAVAGAARRAGDPVVRLGWWRSCCAAVPPSRIHLVCHIQISGISLMAAVQVRRGELAILSRASQLVLRLLGRLDHGSSDGDDSGTDGDGGASGEYEEEDLSASDGEGLSDDDPGALRGAKRARK